jgi:putative aminopeptidase FrvX
VATINEPLLKRLCETPGIPGREGKIAALVKEELANISKEVSVDALGNVTGRLQGNHGPKVMIAAHIDEIGFFVSHIDDNGFLRLQPVGGFDPRVLVAQRVIVWGYDGNSYRGAVQIAAKPIHLLEPSEIKQPKIEELFVDLGMNADETREHVEVGDMVTLDRTLERVGDCVISKSLDDRVGVFVMLEALRKVKSSKADIYAVATTQEEVGLRGAQTAAFAVEPDISIALDVTLAMDIPESKPHLHIAKLGAGAAIKIMDSSVLSNPKLLRHFRDLAETRGITHQLEILPRGGTDAGATALTKSGNAAITLSIPTRYVHTVNEMASVDDIAACIDLLAAYLEDAGSRNYIVDG